ncbi:MAG TPA: alpha/beta hydrolase [Pyrinomonadaceae bacterium]
MDDARAFRWKGAGVRFAGEIMRKRYWVAGAAGLMGVALAAKLLTRPRDVDWDEHGPGLRHARHSRFAELDGVRVHYQQAGRLDAPPIILIHGFTASNFVWGDVLLPIADAGFRVIAPDLVGAGFSSKPGEGEYTIEAQARMIVSLLDHLGLERASLVGSSYGGAVAAACALDYPERVERLVLVAAVTNDEAKRQPLLRLAAAPLLGDIVSPLLLASRRVSRWRLKKVYAAGSEHLFEEERLKAQRLPLLASGTQRALLQTLRRWHAERIEREAHRIKQPALLIWGEDDLDIPLRHGRRLWEQMPDARLVVFRRCGHMPMEEYPREFTELVTDFVNSES